MKMIHQFIRCESGTTIPLSRVLTITVFAANKPPKGVPAHPDGKFNIVAKIDDGAFISIASEVSTRNRAEKIVDEITLLLGDGATIAGIKKRGASTYLYCCESRGCPVVLTPVTRLQEARYKGQKDGSFIEAENQNAAPSKEHGD